MKYTVAKKVDMDKRVTFKREGWRKVVYSIGTFGFVLSIQGLIVCLIDSYTLMIRSVPGEGNVPFVSGYQVDIALCAIILSIAVASAVSMWMAISYAYAAAGKQVLHYINSPQGRAEILGGYELEKTYHTEPKVVTNHEAIEEAEASE